METPHYFLKQSIILLPRTQYLLFRPLLLLLISKGFPMTKFRKGLVSTAAALALTVGGAAAANAHTAATTETTAPATTTVSTEAPATTTVSTEAPATTAPQAPATELPSLPTGNVDPEKVSSDLAKVKKFVEIASTVIKIAKVVGGIFA